MEIQELGVLIKEMKKLVKELNNEIIDLCKNLGIKIK